MLTSWRATHAHPKDQTSPAYPPPTNRAAPAGSGKTTLALEWLASNPSRVAWLSLDADDDNPIRFINGFIAALYAATTK